MSTVIPRAGHEQQWERFRRIAKRNRLANAYLFVGPAGVGKMTFARALAQALLCRRIADPLEACGLCGDCQQVAAGVHGDVEIVRKPADKNYIPIELLIGDREHRMRAGLRFNISRKPRAGGRKIALIDDADYLNIEGANCLLKTLEEPPPGAVIILIASSAQRMLPTIRSRCQMVRFDALPADVTVDLIRNGQLADDEENVQRLAELAVGSMRRAEMMAQQEMRDLRQELLARLGGGEIDSAELAAWLTETVEAAGKEAPLRRQRLLWALEFAAEFFRLLMRRAAVATFGDDGPVDHETTDGELVAAVSGADSSWSRRPLSAAACVERCFQAAAQVKANANLTSLVNCWADDIGQIALSGREETLWPTPAA